jgi:hypothetical protein
MDFAAVFAQVTMSRFSMVFPITTKTAFDYSLPFGVKPLSTASAGLIPAHGYRSLR